MQSVFNALRAGFPAFTPITRAWPQSDASVPAVSFRVKSWEKQKDGSAVLVLRLVLSVATPCQGDDYTSKALLALAPLGYSLAFAEDSVDQATGVFLRILDFAALMDGPAAASALVFSVQPQGSPSLVPVLGLSGISVLPATRQPVPVNTLSLASPSWAFGKLIPMAVKLQGMYLPNDPGQITLIHAFRTNRTDFATSLSRDGLVLPTAQLPGSVFSLACSALGFEAAIQLSGFPFEMQ